MEIGKLSKEWQRVCNQEEEEALVGRRAPNSSARNCEKSDWKGEEGTSRGLAGPENMLFRRLTGAVEPDLVLRRSLWKSLSAEVSLTVIQSIVDAGIIEAILEAMVSLSRL
jgi:hypothetical protein